jgi:hypothetical protein
MWRYLWQLQPWVHYIPFALDSSDLGERIAWLSTHDAEAQKISENARAFMRNISRVEQLQCYTGLMMLEYERLWTRGGN